MPYRPAGGEPSVFVVGRLQLLGSREHTHELRGVMDQNGEMLRAKEMDRCRVKMDDTGFSIFVPETLSFAGTLFRAN